MPIRIKRFERVCAIAELAGTGATLTSKELRDLVEAVKAGDQARKANRKLMIQLDNSLIVNCKLKEALTSRGVDLLKVMQGNGDG